MLPWLKSHATLLATLLTAIATTAIAIFTKVLANSTDKLWQAQKRAFRDTERAFIYIDGFDVELTTAADQAALGRPLDNPPEEHRAHPHLYITRFALSPRWKNSGNTPTKSMTIQTNWTTVLNRSSPEYNYRDDPRRFFVPPNAIERSAFIEIPTAREAVLHNLDKLPEEPVKTLLIWGRTEYQDVFDRSYSFDWCYEIRFDAHKGDKLNVSFVQWHEHNRATRVKGTTP